MKIVILSERVHPYLGGTETRWDEIGKRLVDRGHDITFITGRGDITKSNPYPSSVSKIDHYNGYKIIRPFDYSFGKIFSGTRALSNCFKLGRKGALYIKKLEKKSNFDILDINVFPHIHLPIFMSIYRKNPDFVTWHEVWRKEWRERRGFSILGREIEFLNAQIGIKKIAVSKFTRNRLNKISVNNKIHLVENGINDEFFEIKKTRSSNPNFLFVGRLTPDKNVHSLLVKAFLNVKREYKDAVLHIVGSGQLSELITEISNKYKDINFHGRISKTELKKLYSSSDVFVLPSRREGTGIVAREANAVGMPVVTIKFPTNAAAHETVKHGKNGYVTNESNLSNYMMKAYENKDNMYKNCKRDANKYRWDRIIEKLEKIYFEQSTEK